MIKRLLLPIALIFIARTCMAQAAAADVFSQLSQSPVQTPNGASLAKYVEYPVSYFNGTPDISLPIYEIRSGDIDLPITLSYHAGGIKVSEEASWVGLGWTLNAGGSIIHDVKGLDDWQAGPTKSCYNKVFPYASGNTYQSTFTWVNDWVYNSTIYDPSGNSYTASNLFSVLNSAPSTTDCEPDLYLYNFGGHTGKFFWTNGIGGNLVDLNHNNIKFTNNGTSITAVAPDGYTYVFAQPEKTLSQAYPSIPTTLAWYLTQIISPKGKTITFQYASFYNLYTNNGWSNAFESMSNATIFENGDYVAQLPNMNEQYVNDYPIAVGSYCSAPTLTNGVPIFNSPYNQEFYLDKIIFDDGYIQFQKGPRNDLYGAKLDAINIYRSDNSLVKSINFNYGYFTSQKGNDQFDVTSYLGLKNAYPPDYRANRLQLSYIQKDGGVYSFSYYTGSNGYTLPYKSSYQQDYWGYYNNQTTNTTLIPDFSLYSNVQPLPSDLQSFTGANRMVNATYAVQGSLQKITYPTGGSTEFDYESNSFSNFEYGQANQVQQVTASVYDVGVGTQTTYFTLSAATLVNINGLLFCNSSADDNTSNGTTYDCVGFIAGNPSNSLYVSLTQVDPTTHAPLNNGNYIIWDVNTPIVSAGHGVFTITNLSLAAGTYQLLANYPDNKAPGSVGTKFADIGLSYYQQVPPAPGQQAIGGGLRVNAIKNFDPLTNQTIERDFSYAPGVIMHYPMFYYSSQDNYIFTVTNSLGDSKVTDFYNCVWRTDYMYNSPVLPYSLSANGSAVGYPTVTETVSGGSNGKTEYDFVCNADHFAGDFNNYLPGTPTTPQLDNGFLLHKIDYNGAGQTLREVDNFQTIGLTQTYWNFKYRTHDHNGGGCKDGTCSQGTGSSEDGITDFFNSGQFSFYPVQIGKLLTQTTRETDYTTGGSVQTTKQFTYNGNGDPQTSTMTSSNGTVLETDFAYAPDYTGVSSGFIAQMNAQNMISIPIETLVKRNGNVFDGTYTTYRSHDNILTPNQVYKIETNSPQNITSSAPSGNLPSQFQLKGAVDFDANGNMTYSQPAYDIYTSYLWGYNNSRPVATVAGAQQKDIFYNGFENTDGNGSVGDSKAGQLSRTGGYSITLSNLTNTNYNLSYWQKNGGTWTLQSSVVAVTTGSYTISVSGQVDELRFYPASAQMTSYTYDPVVGLTSVCDKSDHFNYYSYDQYGRLVTVMDQNGNIVKQYDYEYGNSQESCMMPLITNITVSGATLTISYTYNTGSTTCLALVTDQTTGATSSTTLNCNGSGTVTVANTGRQYSVKILNAGPNCSSGILSSPYIVNVP
ncbi:hypothetical protein [Puia dinghuensis]|uniref:YD repeat-containing protein n=1 Tax=Puia dinghuensis TaxID=1792502 RepID=A0A8J2UHA0_9BACT|nr:hypothetical protein [Puia dinghuensis]GGB17625.1 hypothetical protein GCM10011511_46790 [Puia dinghuensis]